MRSIRAAAALVLLTTSVPLAAPQPPAGPAETDPFEGAFVETTGATLILLDVEVIDEQGRPMHGLERKDFRIFLDGAERSIYSVDDFCPDMPEAVSDLPPDIAADMGISQASASETLSLDPVRFVLFFDFSQMGVDGRGRAFREAARWIREVKRPEDPAMIAGYASDSGIRRIYPFSTRSSALLEALEMARDDPELLDAFSHLQVVRLNDCLECSCEPPPTGAPIPDICTECEQLCNTYSVAQQAQARRSLRALRTFLSDLDGIEGRKAMLFFHQNREYGFGAPSGSDLVQTASASNPGAGERDLATPRQSADERSRLGSRNRDPGPAQARGGLDALDEASAEATYSRTTIYPAYAGNDPTLAEGGAASFGARLARLTGGRHNRGPADLPKLIDDAGREATCLYRVGIEPPEETGGGVFRAVVEIAGRSLRSEYRVQYFSGRDLWLRNALNALRNPESTEDLRVEAAVFPVAASKGTWDLATEVSLDLDSLFLLQGTSGRRADWEVGAILIHEDGRSSWQMLGVSRMRSAGDGPLEQTVVHRRVFEDLPPGHYKLAAFVRDRSANLFGASESLIELPRGGRDEMIGPIVMLADRAHLVSGLPDFRKRAAEPLMASTVRRGAVPAGNDPISPGEDLEVLTWLCPRKRVESPGRAWRTVASESGTQWALEPGQLEEAGRCFRISDRIPVSELRPGNYTYRLHWSTDGSNSPKVAEAAFGIDAAGPAE